MDDAPHWQIQNDQPYLRFIPLSCYQSNRDDARGLWADTVLVKHCMSFRFHFAVSTERFSGDVLTEMFYRSLLDSEMQLYCRRCSVWIHVVHISSHVYRLTSHQLPSLLIYPVRAFV